MVNKSKYRESTRSAVLILGNLLLSSAPDYKVRGLLPHYNEIAVDSATPLKEHQLYSTAPNPAPDDRNAYANQVQWR